MSLTTNQLHKSFWSNQPHHDYDEPRLRTQSTQIYGSRALNDPYFHAEAELSEEGRIIQWRRTRYFADFLAFWGGLVFAIFGVIGWLVSCCTRFSHQSGQVKQYYKFADEVSRGGTQQDKDAMNSFEKSVKEMKEPEFDCCTCMISLIPSMCLSSGRSEKGCCSGRT